MFLFLSFVADLFTALHIPEIKIQYFFTLIFVLSFLSLPLSLSLFLTVSLFLIILNYFIILYNRYIVSFFHFCTYVVQVHIYLQQQKSFQYYITWLPDALKSNDIWKSFIDFKAFPTFNSEYVNLFAFFYIYSGNFCLQSAPHHHHHHNIHILLYIIPKCLKKKKKKKTYESSSIQKPKYKNLVTVCSYSCRDINFYYSKKFTILYTTTKKKIKRKEKLKKKKQEKIKWYYCIYFVQPLINLI